MAWYQCCRCCCHSKIRSENHAAFGWSSWQRHLFCIGKWQEQWLWFVFFDINLTTISNIFLILVGVTNDQGKSIGIMFLVFNQILSKNFNSMDLFSSQNEVALGKEHTITVDDSSLKKPPANFDSVVARGQTEPGKR